MIAKTFYQFIFGAGLLLLSNNLLATTYYVSKKGKDSNNGTINAPFRSISKAATMAVAGDTVYVFEGVYRERVAPPRGGTAGSPIVYMAEPHKNVFIKGSDIWEPDWRKAEKNIYKAVPDQTMFNDDAYVDDKNPFKVISAATPYGRSGSAEIASGYQGDPNVAYTCGQVFVDGQLYIQKPYFTELEASPESWFYNKKTAEIYIHFSDDSPKTHTVEISTRRRIFAPHLRGLAYITVQGFIMEHCGNQYPKDFWKATKPEWQQAGAIGTRSGRYWVIKNNIIRFANGIGIDFGNEGDSNADLERGGNNGPATNSGHHLIDANYITDNGACGTAAYYPVYITFTNNVVERNNNLLYSGEKRWESGGVKMHRPDHAVIANNLVRNNYGERGIWLDQGSGKNTRVHANLIIGNRYGFDLEIGPAYPNNCLFDHNILIHNDFGISIREAGGLLAVHNLIINSSKFALSNEIDKTRTSDGWSSAHNYFFNNVFTDQDLQLLVCPPDYLKSSDRRFDFNYYYSDQKKGFQIKGIGGVTDFTDWQAKWAAYNQGQYADQHSHFIESSLDYLFNDRDLTLVLYFDQKSYPSSALPVPQVTQDYFGTAISPGSKEVLSGPIQNLQLGSNTVKLWSGIKPLKAYQNLYQ
jgi:hypothetical protein